MTLVRNTRNYVSLRERKCKYIIVYRDYYSIMADSEKESDSEREGSLSGYSDNADFIKPRGRPPRNKRKATESPPLDSASHTRKSSRKRHTEPSTSTGKSSATLSAPNTNEKFTPINRDKNCYSSLYFLNSSTTTSRVEMAQHWGRISPLSTDVILQTSKGFLLKSNTAKEQLIKLLSVLIQSKAIDSFTETSARTNDRTQTAPPETFAAVITQVDFEIEDQTISQALNDNNIIHRFCKRIISRASTKPTTLIRIITGNAEAFRRLMNEGVFVLNKHFRAAPSSPPPPMPQPCSKCTQFTHTTEQCPNEIICSKCNGNHRTDRCTTNLPIKCTSCGAADHVAWSIKCPRHPKKPIEGIPNTQIKPLNKKTREMDKNFTRNKRIHEPITIHDFILNTYSRKINKPSTTNRDQLIQALKKRFIKEYNIDTTVAFTGNWMYILMIDLEYPEDPSPTQPTNGSSYQVNQNVP